MRALAKYVDILFRHRLRFLILLVVLPVEVAIACIPIFPHESAVSSLWVDTPAYFSISPAATGWNQYLTPAQNTQDALDQLRNTGAFVHTLGLDLDTIGTFRDTAERNSVLASVTTDLHVTATGSHLVVMTYTCPREPICTNVLTNTVQIYRNWLADQQTAQAKVAIDFYTGQLNDAVAKLQADETALNQYVDSHPSVKPSDAPLIPEFDQLLRNVEQDRIEVAALQQKLDAIKLTDAAAAQIDSTVLKVVDPPHVVGSQLSSMPRKQMAIAAGAALALGLLVLIVMAWFDRNVREPQELESRLRIPVVVTIPDLASAGATGG
jgi:uncharacterized protein involved in exopolysaccharide biosynthesis